MRFNLLNVDFAASDRARSSPKLYVDTSDHLVPCTRFEVLTEVNIFPDRKTLDCPLAPLALVQASSHYFASAKYWSADFDG